MTTLINTPTGNIGRALAERLLDAGEELVLLHRDPAKVSELAARGARVVEGSTDDPAALERAFGGTNGQEPVDTVFWLTPPAFQPDFLGWAEGAARAAVDAARSHGVRRVVVLSSVGAQSERVGPVSALSRVEAVFRAAHEAGDLDELVLLRPGFFMENLLRDVPTIAAEGAFYAPLPADRPLPMVATRDIAAVAAEEIRSPRRAGLRVRELHGPEDLSQDDIAAILSQALEREVRFVSVPEEAARGAMAEAGMPDFVVSLFLEMLAGVREGRMVPEAPRSAETTTPTHLHTFARETIRPALAGS